MTYLCAWWDRSGIHVLDHRDVIELAKQIQQMEARGLTATTEPTDEQRRRIWDKVQGFIASDANEETLRLRAENRELKKQCDELADHYRAMLVERIGVQNGYPRT